MFSKPPTPKEKVVVHVLFWNNKPWPWWLVSVWGWVSCWVDVYAEHLPQQVVVASAQASIPAGSFCVSCYQIAIHKNWALPSLLPGLFTLKKYNWHKWFHFYAGNFIISFKLCSVHSLDAVIMNSEMQQFGRQETCVYLLLRKKFPPFLGNH